ncbi:MAG: dTMP kinase [Firmicutes bacterium]|nr:dTMP kinase [Bacillota bacterium]
MPLITLEGIDASGKTTQIKYLQKNLYSLGADKVIVTQEPGGTVVGKEISHLVLKRKELDIYPSTEVFLFAADRAQHVMQVIKPALTEGHFVVSDRFVDSSIAFQGAAGMQKEFIQAVNHLAIADIKPHLTIWLDIPVEVTVERLDKRGESDRLESKGVVYLQRVRDFYTQMAENEPYRFKRIDGTQKPEEIAKQIRQLCKDRFFGR